MSTAIPIILCGQSTGIASSVKNGLLPEIEVIHVLLTTSSALSLLPSLLQGSAPSPPDPTNVGSQNYTKPPAAVCLGAGYDDGDLKAMRDACKGVSHVPWLRADMERPRPPLGPHYGKHMIERVKAAFVELEREGKMGKDGVHWY